MILKVVLFKTMTQNKIKIIINHKNSKKIILISNLMKINRILYSTNSFLIISIKPNTQILTFKILFNTKNYLNQLTIKLKQNKQIFNLIKINKTKNKVINRKNNNKVIIKRINKTRIMVRRIGIQNKTQIKVIVIPNIKQIKQKIFQKIK